MEIKGYITNLGKYNEGKLIGKWITFPISDNELNEVLKKIGCYYVDENWDEQNIDYEEYFFTDWDGDFGFGEYESIDNINEIAEVIDDIDKDILEACLDNLSGNWDADDLKAMAEDAIVYDGCHTMADVAEQYCDECGLLDLMPENLRHYFDYEKFGRDMEIEGNFVETANGFVEILR